MKKILIIEGEPEMRRDVAMNLGADEYLTKPVAKTDLLGAIRSRLARN